MIFNTELFVSFIRSTSNCRNLIVPALLENVFTIF